MSGAPPVVSALCLGAAGPGPVSLCLQCDQFVSQYEPVLIEVLVEVMEPTFVCSVSSAGAVGSRAVSRAGGGVLVPRRPPLTDLAMGQSLWGRGVGEPRS